MRLVFACTMVALLAAGCKREPSFDEKYAATKQRLDAKAQAIDKELAVAASEAALAGETGEPSGVPQ